MIKSMTGFGAADGEVGGARVSVEIRSVNHRFFNPSIKLPSELAKWEGEVREAMRRGDRARTRHAHARASSASKPTPSASTKSASPRTSRSCAHFTRSYELGARRRRRRCFDCRTSSRRRRATCPEHAAELTAIVERAVAALDAMRAGEGARLETYLEERLAIIEQARRPHRRARAGANRRAARPACAQRFRNWPAASRVDEHRLAQEIAILADRLDVAEEVSRFHSHFAAFRATLSSPPAGRRRQAARLPASGAAA